VNTSDPIPSAPNERPARRALSRRRVRAALARWGDVVLLAILGYAAGVLLVRYLDCGRVAQWPLSAWVAALVAALVGLWVLARPYRSAWFGVRWFLFYPPTWVAGLLGAAGVVIHALALPTGLLHPRCAWTRPSSTELHFVAIETLWPIGLALLIAAFISIAFVLVPTRKVRVPPKAGASFGSDFAELETWILDDSPISSTAEDRFAHSGIAKRIYGLLLEPGSPTVALVAPLGAGKSSVRNLVLEQVARDPTHRPTLQLVTVGLWPFNTLEAGIAGVLSAVTGALAQHVNTSSLRGLEQEYVDAIEGVGGPVGKLLRLARPDSPSAILKRFDRVASAVGLKVVLWVEDFERFAGLHRGATEPEYIRLTPLRALLNELAELQSFQVVLSSSAADYRFDLEKLARYVISIPPPQAVDMGALILGVRQKYLARYPVADAASPAERARLWPDESNLGWLAAWRPLTLQRALGALCGSPRLLKQALRSFVESWRVLHGEVDVDDLLMVSVLGVASPKVVELLNEHINVLRTGSRERLVGKPAKPSPFALALNQVLERTPELDAEAVRFVVGELFSGWATGEAGSGSKRPQGFSETHSDYWLRYWAQSPPETARSDQRMLQLVAEWSEGKGKALAEVMVSGGHPDSLEALLAVRLGGADLLRLLEEVVRAEFATGRHTWGGGVGKSDPPALISLWRIMLKNQPAPDSLVQVLRNLYREVMPTNMALAFELIYFFATPSNQVQSVLSVEQIQSVQTDFRREIGLTFGGRSPQLIEALRGADMHILLWSCWGLDRVRSGALQGLPLGWEDLRVTILDALRLCPEVMVPQALPFVVQQQQGFEWGTLRAEPRSITTFTWDREATERLFGLDAFTAAIRSLPELEFPVPEAQGMFDCVRSQLSSTNEH